MPKEIKGVKLSKRNWNSKEYKRWRISVYRRDKFKCKWPNCRCSKKLNAHHILSWAKYPSVRFEVTNGITLCKKHHALITGQESHFAEFLSKLIGKGRRTK